MSDLFQRLSPGVGGLFQTSGADHVAILLATFNGADMLPAQLESIARQSHANWSLIVSDDGSSDATADVVRSFATRVADNRVTLICGPRRGSAQNFLSLLRAAGRAPFVAFCDQDDVWFDDKLERALTMLTNVSHPAIYGSATLITDKQLRPLRESPSLKKPTSFQNALVQNVAGGNTMLLNRKALDALQPASRFAKGIVAHDWWSYQMVTGIGGELIFDPVPSLFYRQHGANQIGANDSLSAQIARMRRVLDGQFTDWLDVHFEALLAARQWLQPQALSTVAACRDLKDNRATRRLRALKRSGVYRQTLAGSLSLGLAAAIGRL